MQEYSSKSAFIDEIKKTAKLFIDEFEEIEESEKNIRYNEVDRTPQEIIAYQLGWMSLLRGWDSDEMMGKEVITPEPGYKWNQLGGLYQSFYTKYKSQSLKQLIKMFVDAVDSLVEWLNEFDDDELFQSGGRKWAASTNSNWPVWKWIHINTVAPFKSFRTKIRKWKKVHQLNKMVN
jgi:hypothetical protein